MDFIREINEWVMSSEEEDDFVGEAERRVARLADRRPYRTLERSSVDDFDDVEFKRYFRLNKETFWKLHNMIEARIDGDVRRCVLFVMF